MTAVEAGTVTVVALVWVVFIFFLIFRIIERTRQ